MINSSKKKTDMSSYSTLMHRNMASSRGGLNGYSFFRDDTSQWEIEGGAQDNEKLPRSNMTTINYNKLLSS